MRHTLLASAVLLCLCLNSFAETPAEIALQRRLDQPFTSKIDGVALSKAFEDVQNAAKIKILVDQAAYDSLVYGATTKISAEFRSAPLRAAIGEILLPLSLEQVVSGDTVIIRPSPALLRVGRRTTWDELKLLQTLRTTQLPRLDVDWQQDIRSLVGKADLLVRIEGADGGLHDKGMQAVKAVLPCTIEQALDTYSGTTGLVWTVDQNSLLIMTKRRWVERQLQRPVIIKQFNGKTEQVVNELSRLSRVRLVPDPGLYDVVPTLTLDSDSTLQRTLDSLAGSYRITTEIVEDTIALRLPGTPPAAARGEIVGRVSVPMSPGGPVFDLFIRDTDLTPEQNEQRKRRLTDAINDAKATLVAPPAPAAPARTQPTPATTQAK